MLYPFCYAYNNLVIEIRLDFFHCFSQEFAWHSSYYNFRVFKNVLQRMVCNHIAKDFYSRQILCVLSFAFYLISQSLTSNPFSPNKTAKVVPQLPAPMTEIFIYTLYFSFVFNFSISLIKF